MAFKWVLNGFKRGVKGLKIFSKRVELILGGLRDG